MADESAAGPLVSLSGLRKSLPGFHLGPVDFEMEAGYVVAVLGPNGSGKTTLFRLLLDLVHPDSGELHLFGRAYPADELAIKSRIGYVPDDPVGIGDLDADELGEFVRHWYPTWDPSRYAELLARFDIDPGKRFRRLSKGMRQRLSLATALATQAPLLVLDEPTDALDPLARRTALDEISDHAADGTRSVLLATHVVDEARRVADYVVFVHDGRCLGMYEKDALLQSWRALWVDPSPEGELPGLVSVEAGNPARLVTREPAATRSVLRERGVEVVRSSALDLDEILAHLVTESGPVGVAGGRDRR